MRKAAALDEAKALEIFQLETEICLGSLENS